MVHSQRSALPTQPPFRVPSVPHPRPTGRRSLCARSSSSPGPRRPHGAVSRRRRVPSTRPDLHARGRQRGPRPLRSGSGALLRRGREPDRSGRAAPSGSILGPSAAGSEPACRQPVAGDPRSPRTAMKGPPPLAFRGEARRSQCLPDQEIQPLENSASGNFSLLRCIFRRGREQAWMMGIQAWQPREHAWMMGSTTLPVLA